MHGFIVTMSTDSYTRVRALRSSLPSGSHLSLSPEHPGGPRPPRCFCRLSPQGGPRMGPALSPPSPCRMCLRIGRPRGPAARIRVRVYRPHYTAGPPRRFTTVTGCRPVVPRGRHARRGSDPSPVHGTCFRGSCSADPVALRLRGQPVGVYRVQWPVRYVPRSSLLM